LRERVGNVGQLWQKKENPTEEEKKTEHNINRRNKQKDIRFIFFIFYCSP
jgi:hypothetical protein